KTTSGSNAEPCDHAFVLSGAKLKALTTACGVTTNSLIRALWAVLLHKATDRKDVVFGATVSGRPEALEGVERMVGLMINTVPVRVRVRSEATLSELAQTVQAELAEAQVFETTPLAKIQNGRELFDHILVFENYPL